MQLDSEKHTHTTILNSKTDTLFKDSKDGQKNAFAGCSLC